MYTVIQQIAFKIKTNILFQILTWSTGQHKFGLWHFVNYLPTRANIMKYFDIVNKQNGVLISRFCC